MIRIYNTLTRKKEEFTPLEEGKIKMYVCGPTVYDVPHIGHARSAFSFDVIRRYFEYAGFQVHFVRNVTDIDDKIINKAVSELEEMGTNISGSALKTRADDVAVRYLDEYHHELDILGIKPPTVEPKATENIKQMFEFIQILIDKGFAYASGGDVYFSVEKFSGYGKLSNRNKDEMLHGVRVDVDEKKKYPLDFALWKEAKENEPFWESPWGDGRPGWHIECSVMSTNILGNRFDIHGGGLDLIFPHHENEIAQAEAATGETFANYWIHNGLLSVNGEKMSKSLGNYITISDFRTKYSDSDLLKIAFLSSHYRSPMDYSDEKMDEAHRTKERIMIFFDKVEKLEGDGDAKKDIDPSVLPGTQATINNLRIKFNEAMDDDFNTPSAMAVVFEAVKAGNECLADEDVPKADKLYITYAIKNYIVRMADVLGLSLTPAQIEADEQDEIEKLVAEREKARKSKDFNRSDEIRDVLLEKCIVVEDTPEGPVWRKN